MMMRFILTKVIFRFNIYNKNVSLIRKYAQHFKR